MAGYIGNVPVPQATQTRDSFVATAGQTSFATSGYTPGYLDVYLNGVRLDESDYTATNGSDVVLDTGAAVDDVVTVVAFQTFEVNAGISLDDNVKAKFGDGDDLQIYHNGSASYIEDVGTGGLAVTTNGAGIYLQKGATETLAQFGIDGESSLYYDNSKKLATTSSGVDVTGNLLVGTTDSSPYNNNANTTADNGIVLTDGRVWAARSGGSPLDINRTTSDGDIAVFRKSGTQVGSIGAISSTPYITGTAGGLRLIGTEVRPVTSTGVNYGDATNLGNAGVRFKDLYLSGGVYLGGTGSANHLDDYEEGTFTAGITATGGGTITLESGYNELAYTKIGNMVHIHGVLLVDSVSSPTGGITITGTPFSLANLTDMAGRAYVSVVVTQSTKASGSWWGQMVEGGTGMIIYSGDGVGGGSSANLINANTGIHISTFFRAN